MRHPLVGPVRRAAANLAAWHDRSVGAIGATSRLDRRWWTCRIEQPSIWFTAISLTPASSAGDRSIADILGDATAVASVCDSYDTLDLSPQGLVRARSGPWYARPPRRDTPTVRCPPGSEIIRVSSDDQLAAFERTAVLAFGTPAPPVPFTLHAPGILADPAMSVWLARADGVPVATAMTYDAFDVRGVYAVGTIPEARGRGFATALMATVLAERPDATATLQPSTMATGLYQSLGFGPIGDYTFWCTC